MSMSEADLELISAGFTAILGFQVVPPSRGHGLPKFTVQELFKVTYTASSLEGIDPGEVFDIDVFFRGSQMTIQVTDNHTIGDVKADIATKQGISSRDIRLTFNGNPVEDHQIVRDLGIRKRRRRDEILRLKGGGPDRYQLDTDQFDQKHHYDFTNDRDDGRVYYRGGKEYKRPYGWKRFAVKVLGQYENNAWLGQDGYRTQQTQGEWPVSYHGTDVQAAQNIIASGYKAGPGQAFGKAVYSSPSLDMVEQYYAKSFEHGGTTYKIALQNRINPSPDHFVVIPAEQTGVGAEYWLSPKHDTEKNIHDIRPYGLLFKDIAKNGVDKIKTYDYVILLKDISINGDDDKTEAAGNDKTEASDGCCHLL